MHQLTQIDLTAKKEIKTNFGFIPNPRISNHLNVNACQVLGNTTTQEYFNHFINKSFHDLIAGKSIPASAACILGNRLKFIPNPKKIFTGTILTKQGDDSLGTRI